jgi:hypothetical protein
MSLVTQIPNQYAKVGTAYSFQFDAGTFSGTGLTYEAYINRPNQGRSLPSWLSFDSATRTFSGTPTNWYEAEALQIVVECTDSVPATSYCIFTIVVGAADNTGRTVWRSGSTPGHILTAANIAAYNTGTISAGQWVVIDTDVVPSGTALTKINEARANGGFIVWKLNNSNRLSFLYSEVDAGETIALDFSAGNIAYIRPNGNCTGLRGKEIMFTNYNEIGIIKDSTTNPILLTGDDGHIRFIGQPADNTPYNTNCYGIKVTSNKNTLAKVNAGFNDGIEFSFVEAYGGPDDSAIGFHIKTDITLTFGDRRPSANTGSRNCNMRWIQVHDCYIYDTEGEGVYIGGGFYGGGSSTLPDRFYHDIEYARVEWNIALNTGWDALQMKNVIREGRMMYNYVKDTGTLPGASNAQRFGVFVGDGFVGDVAYNWVESSGRTAIRHYDTGYTKIYNNVVYNSGKEGGYGAKVANPVWNINTPIDILVNKNLPANIYSVAPTTSYTSRADLADGDLLCHIFHNTFINCLDTLVLFTATPVGQIRAQNNLFVNCGRTTISIPSGSVNSGNVILNEVLLTNHFVDPDNKDFRILIGSSANGAGDDISSYYTNTDYNGTSYVTLTPSAGAFEFGSVINQDRYNYVATGNILPTVNAGSNQSINSLNSSIVLTGTATDSDGTISSQVWTQISGPNTATLANETTLVLTASNLIVGTYIFRLTATDNSGGISFDEVSVTVNSDPDYTFHKFYQADDNVGTNETLIAVTTDVNYSVPTGLNKWFRRGSIPKAKTGTETGDEVFTNWINVL